MHALMKKLGYEFNDPTILRTAMTHRSKGSDHNERLEFLGDAVVNFIIADALFQAFPEAREGELSRLRASLVNREALAKLAQRFAIGNYLLLGAGEIRSGGRNRLSILSCAMEAVIGAIYCDAGFEAVQKIVLVWFEEWMGTLSAVCSSKDPKTQLQEYVQSKRYDLPLYTIVNIEGEAHQQLFTISCEVPALSLKSEGKGTSRRRAEQEAAENLLKVLKKS